MNTEVETVETPVTVEAPTTTRQMTFTLLDSGIIQAEFGEGIPTLQLDPAKVPESLIAAAMAEGLTSRARGYTSKLTGADRTPQALHDAVAKAFENLMAGVWKIERAPGTGSSEFSIEVEASHLFRQMRAKAKGEEFTGTLQEAAEAFAKLTEDSIGPDGKKVLGQKSQLKALPRYKLAYAEIKAARDAAKMKALQEKIEKEEQDVNF